MSKRILGIIALILLTACAPGPPRPVEIEPADMCALCKMAISQKQYCAELIDAERNVFKFDDIGCMLRFAGEHAMKTEKAGQIHLFVVDYGKRSWIEGRQALYVQSESIQSPMGSGLIAVSDSKGADRYAAQFHGRRMSFQEVWK